MRISAINSFTYQPKSNFEFKGLLKDRGFSADSWDYYGEVSSYNGDGHYVGSNDYQEYTYHPFKDEPESAIAKKISENNYSQDYSSMGYGGGLSVSTTRGKTIPYTEKEWNRLSKRDQERIMSIL